MPPDTEHKPESEGSLAEMLVSTPGLKWCLAIAILLLVAASLDAYFTNFFVKQGDITLITVFGTVGGSLTLYFLFFRLYIQERILRNQTAKEIDDSFIKAIDLLGNSHTSARTGAIYSLRNLAVESRKYRTQIASILCSHLRSNTQKALTPRTDILPFNEIQTVVDVLFKNKGGKKGLYCKYKDSLPRADLSNSNMENVSFEKAQCQNAIFRNANCSNAKFQMQTVTLRFFILRIAKIQHLEMPAAKVPTFSWHDARRQISHHRTVTMRYLLFLFAMEQFLTSLITILPCLDYRAFYDQQLFQCTVS